MPDKEKTIDDRFDIIVRAIKVHLGLSDPETKHRDIEMLLMFIEYHCSRIRERIE